MYYRIRNRTSVTQHLYDSKLDCVHIPANATVTIDKKFIDFQMPPISVIQVLGPVDTKVNAMKKAKALKFEKAAKADANVESIKEKLGVPAEGTK